LSTTEASVRAMIQRRQLAVQKIGRRVFIERSELGSFLRSRIVR